MRAVLVPVLLAALGCGGPIEAARPVGSEFIEVDYPHPPAQVEEMTERLNGRPECRWLDGYYRWQGRRWEWVPGQWFVPPARCARAPGSLSWSKERPPKLYYTPPYWYSTDLNRQALGPACAPPVPCQSQPSPIAQ